MNIAFLAHDRKKDLMVQLCFAYKSILEKHTLCATNTTGKLISEATGMPVTLYLHANQGGAQQIGARISYNEIDLVFYFRSTDPSKQSSDAEMNLLRLCDVYNVPVATNIATAEVIIMALDRGDLDWRLYMK